MIPLPSELGNHVLTRTTNVLNNETNINPIKRHCCLWLTFWILNNTHNAPLLSRGLPQVTFDLPGTCWIQIKCRFILLRLNKLNPSTRPNTVGTIMYLDLDLSLTDEGPSVFSKKTPRFVQINDTIPVQSRSQLVYP